MARRNAKTQISTLDRTNLKALRAAIDANISAIAEQFGVSLSLGRCKFTDSNATFNLEVAVLNGATGEAETKEAVAFKSAAVAYGLREDAVGETFEHRGETFKLLGFLPRGQRYPFVVLNMSTGRRHKITEEPIIAAFGASKKKVAKKPMTEAQYQAEANRLAAGSARKPRRTAAEREADAAREIAKAERAAAREARAAAKAAAAKKEARAAARAAKKPVAKKAVAAKPARKVKAEPQESAGMQAARSGKWSW